MIEFSGEPSKENNFISTGQIVTRYQYTKSKIRESWTEASDALQLLDDPESREIFSDQLNGLSIQDAIANCTLCGLRRCCRGPVSLDGARDTLNRGFSVVGLMAPPNSEDDVEGLPVSGHQRKLLETACQKTGLHIDAYLSSTCCRTPQNRQPTEKELKSCRINLVSQVEYLDPWLIICFGAAAVSALRPDFSIAVDHGVFFPVVFPELGNKVIWGYGIFSPYHVLNAREKTPNNNLLRSQFSDDFKHVSACVKVREEFGAEILHPIMDSIQKESPYIPNQKKKTEKLRTTYLQKMELAEDEREERKNGKKVSTHTQQTVEIDYEDMPF
jgi:uracil-DNA glycosylase family 4